MTYETIAYHITRLLLFLAFLWFLRQRYFLIRVPSASMAPLVRPGDLILVRQTNHVKQLNRFDLVVFRSTPRQKGEGHLLMIKRVVGLPGDQVELKGGALRLNRKEQAEPYVVFSKDDDMSVRVPAGSCLVLGDNRAASHDARYWTDPFVLEHDIAGVAALRFWPLGRIAILK